MIEVEKLTKQYGDITAVDQISFAIQKQEIVGILGHNGAGKTTTLKMVTGFLEPSAGVVRINGKPMETQRLSIQKQMGYLPENSPLYPEMTVLEYLDYVADLWGVAQGDKSSLIREALAQTRLEEVSSQLIETLSKGYKQRVGVAQAILHRPEIFILDEPTNGLDPTQIIQMRQLIQDLSQRATIIISTHILQEIEAVCDRVIVIHGGKIARDAQLAELQSSGAVCVSLGGAQQQVKKQLSGLPEVTDVAVLGQTSAWVRYRVSVGGREDKGCAAISRMAAQQGWTLYELAPQKVTLEQVFRQINEGGAHV
ncbi:MAG: ABC transporter ATP-binding protein [Myxococcota bacterium]